MLTFFQEPFSHWCVKVQKILEYKRIPHESKRVGYHDKTELIAATGQDYVPALVHDGRVVTFPDIPDHLERLQPTPTIYPGGVRASARLVENWAHWRLEEIVWRFVVPDFPRTFTDELERWVFVEIQTFKRGPLELMAARRGEFKADLDVHLQLLEDMLAGREFLLGGPPSLADFAVYGALFPLTYSGNEVPGQFERLRAWQERVSRL